MKFYEHPIRTRYAETDQMGVIHHAAYLVYLEEARTEILRQSGISYAEIEAAGIFLPIAKVDINYKLPLVYDENIIIRTCLKAMEGVKLLHYYEILKENGTIACTAETILIFVDKATKRPCRPPEHIAEKMQSFID